MSLNLVVVLICLWAFSSRTTCDKPPNIIYFLADDLGWNDISFHGSPQIPTPNIDALAASGIILNSFYVAPQCTPSRAALMTGLYQIHTGLQHFVIRSGEATALPLTFPLMPQQLKRLGYKTHMVGKWHLGFYKKEFSPTFRGFDSFFGYLNGRLDYYDYTNYETVSVVPGQTGFWGIDFYNGTKTIRHLRGKYSQDVFAEKAVEIIENHDISQPIFLYMSNQAVHTGNAYQPIQATPERVTKFPYIKDAKRRQFAGVVSSLDDTMGKLFVSLNEKGILNNTIIVFSSDNGAETSAIGGQGSSFPLRGRKFDLWEGGVRAPAVVWSPLLKLEKPRSSTQLMHICDWLPTFYSAAGGNVSDLGEIDGKDMWQSLVNNSPSLRNEIILQIDPLYDMSALRQGDLKLVQGTYPNATNVWYGPSGRDDITVQSMDAWVWKNGSVVKNILQKNGWWLIEKPDEWRKDAVVSCGKGNIHPPFGNGGCDPTWAPCLFNITNDPCEYHNIAFKNFKIVRQMMKRIREYNATAMKVLSKESDPHADPRCHDFAYVPWLDEEYLSDCPYV